MLVRMVTPPEPEQCIKGRREEKRREFRGGHRGARAVSTEPTVGRLMPGKTRRQGEAGARCGVGR